MINNLSFQNIFKSSLFPELVLLPNPPFFTIAAVTSAYLKTFEKEESALIGKSIFEIFSDNQEVNSRLCKSLQKVISTKFPEKMETQKYHIQINKNNGFKENYWEIRNNPVLDEAGEIQYIIHTVLHGIEKISEKFQVNDESYKNLIQNGTDMISVIDLQGNYIYVSPAASPILGYDGKDLMSKSVFEFIHPDDQEAVNANFSKLGSVKKLRILPFRFRHKDGSWKWLETIVTDLTDEPSVHGIVTNSRDITDRINAEEKLKVSEEKYRLLFQYSPIPKWVYDLDTLKILDVNETAIHHYGYSREEFLKMTVKDMRAKEEIPALLKAIENSNQNAGLINFGTYKHLKKDKTPIIVEITGHKFSSSGKVCLMVDCFDVTERENALKQIKESEAKLLTAIKIAKLGYWKLDIKKEKIDWSDEVYNIWGVSKESFKPNITTFLKTIHPDDLAAFEKEQKSSLSGKKEHNIEHRILCPDGSTKWVQEKGNLIKNELGEPVIFQGTVRDITEEKLLELSLEESNQRYNYVLKATFDAIWDWNLVTDINLWGEGFSTVFGYNLDSLQSRTFWSEHIHPEDHDVVFNGMRAAINGTGTNWANQYRFKKADGSYAFVSDRALIIRDKNGKAIRMVGAIQDITEKKILEQLLDKANRLARIGSWEIDVASNTVYWSDITKEIREAAPDFHPTLQHGIGNFKDGADRETISKKVMDCMQHGTSWEEDLQIITEKGNLKWIRTIGKAELVNGKCVKIYGSFQDIDATKKAELEIIKLYQEKNTILESIGDAFFALDKNWIVTYWNKEAEKMLRVPKTDIIGKYLWDVFPNSLNLESYKKYTKAVETNKAVLFEDYYTPLNKWFEISAYPSENGLSVYVKDITQRKLSEIELNKLNETLHKKAAELAVSNAELEQFAYAASHDLQEPLRMVTGFLKQLEKKYSDVIDETGKQYIFYAVDGATRMRKIIQDLLEYSRVGRLQGSVEKTDINEIIKQFIILHQKQIEETDAILNYENLPVLKNFQSPLRQVFQNLLNNALKYHRKDVRPVIDISAKETPEHWIFSIADNGIGISPEHFEQIFILFQRLHDWDEYGGTGIGLPIVKKIVKSLGGEISVESEIGRGSRFTFSIKKIN